MDKKIKFTSYTLEEIQELFLINQIEEYRAKQIFGSLYEKYTTSFDDINNIPKLLKEKLNSIFTLDIPEIMDISKSEDNTTKFLLKLEDGNTIECVYLPYNDRNSICVSTQVGCPVGCDFCASCVNGYIRNLEVSEIIGQILAVQKEINKKITHVVYMGIGEPLLNYNNVVRSINIINRNLNLSERRITVSTSGIVSKIKKLATADLDITLALSLHTPYQYDRIKLIPTARENTIDDLLLACDDYFTKTKRRITWEYLLIKGVNDSELHAKSLANLAKLHKAHINLIPYNPVKGKRYKRPDYNAIRKFNDVLKSHKVVFSIRQEKGTNENAACGQLRNEN